MLKLIRFSSRFVKLTDKKIGTKNVLLPLLSTKLSNRTFCTESPINSPNFEVICNGDKDLEHKLRVLALEVEVMRQEGRLVPDEAFFKDNHWQELLKLATLSARRKYLEYLFKLSKTKENRQLKKAQRREDWEQNRIKRTTAEDLEEFASTYDLQNNTIFLRVYDSTIHQFYNSRLIRAMMFGSKLVVDCGYFNNMTPIENKNCAKQLMLLFAENRMNDDPFDLYFVNADPESLLMKTLHKNIATMYEPWFPLNIHQTSYLDLFPKEKLVYLTPHCKEEITEYDHDSVYIIGGIVDKVNNEPLSLAKAKREGLKMAKFPLDRYLNWGSGSGKSLTLNQTASILLDLKATGDWQQALRHVPRRKLMDFSNNQRDPSRVRNNNNNNNNVKSWSPSANSKLSKWEPVESKPRERKLRLRSIMFDE